MRSLRSPLDPVGTTAGSALRRRDVLGALAALGLAGGAHAQGRYPERTVRIIVPFTGGGTIDTPARRLSLELGKRLGQTVIIDNRPGAGGLLGTQAMLAAPPDGYTLLTINTRLNQFPAIYPEANYDVYRDFAPLGQLCTAPLMLAVPTSLGVDTLDAFVKLLRSRPSLTSYASSGTGSTANVYAEEFKRLQGLDSVHVPYPGDANLLSDLVSNRVQWFLGTPIALAGFAQQGKVKLLAVTGPQRIRKLPDVPTFTQAGFPGFEAVGWIGLFGPAKMPADVRKRLVQEVEAITQGADYQAFMVENMVVPPPPGNDFLADMKRLDAVWSKMIQANGITMR